MMTMQRPYLQNYLTFYYEYLPKINEHHIKKEWCKLVLNEVDENNELDEELDE